MAVGGVGIFNTFAINVAAPVPVVVKLVILFVYAVSQFAWDDVVGIEYPAVKLNTPVVFVYVKPVAVELNEASVIPPNPAKVYVGTFNTPEIRVDDPDDPVVVNDVNAASGGVGILRVDPTSVAAPVPVVVNVIAFCLLLNAFQSAELKYPLVDVVACVIDTLPLVSVNGALKV